MIIVLYPDEMIRLPSLVVWCGQHLHDKTNEARRCHSQREAKREQDRLDLLKQRRRQKARDRKFNRELALWISKNPRDQDEKLSDVERMVWANLGIERPRVNVQ